MSYLYCLRIHIETQEDVNALFRNSELKGELIANSQREYFICPKLSYTMWSIYPQSKALPAIVDENWHQAIFECISLLEQNYTISYCIEDMGWKEVGSVYRCSLMESFIRELDIVVKS